MNVSSVGSASALVAALMASQTAQAQVADNPHDGDADDMAGAAPSVQAAPAPGTGQVVDKTA